MTMTPVQIKDLEWAIDELSKLRKGTGLSSSEAKQLNLIAGRLRHVASEL